MIREMRRKSIWKAFFWTLGFIIIVTVIVVSTLVGNSPFGTGSIWTNVVFAIFIILYTIITTKSLCVAIGKKYLKGIKEFCNQADNPAQMMACIEHVWINAEVATEHCRIDSEYLIYGDGVRSVVISWNRVQEVYTKILRSGSEGLIAIDAMITLNDGTANTVRIDTKPAHKTYIEKLRAMESDMFNLIAKHHPNILLKSEPKAGNRVFGKRKTS